MLPLMQAPASSQKVCFTTCLMQAPTSSQNWGFATGTRLILK
jgi:hypothetical protein